MVGTAACPPDNYIPAPDAADTPIAGVGTNLAQYDGQLADGTWRLCVADSAVFDTGTLQSWSLIVTAAPPATPPQFSYTPSPPGPVTGVHTTGTVGSTANFTISVAIGTAGSGSGAAATTTTTCAVSGAGFAGFTATPTAVGAGPVSPTSITGTCTVAADRPERHPELRRESWRHPGEHHLQPHLPSRHQRAAHPHPQPGTRLHDHRQWRRPDRLDRQLLDLGHRLGRGGQRRGGHHHPQLHPARRLQRLRPADPGGGQRPGAEQPDDRAPAPSARRR
ncbi:MAG: proprotein convertase P-domain-containing protein [Xanthomonadales bacterium]|nr:proprotein convertase P-domain-containing protein [Xanthomonadales bacterium]